MPPLSPCLFRPAAQCQDGEKYFIAWTLVRNQAAVPWSAVGRTVDGHYGIARHLLGCTFLAPPRSIPATTSAAVDWNPKGGRGACHDLLWWRSRGVDNPECRTQNKGYHA